MSKNNVVAISAHPKFRSVAALREYLEGQEGQWGTPIDLAQELDSKDPATRQMLYDLNAWCEGLKHLDSTMQHCEDMLKGGMKKGDFYSHGALPAVVLPGPAPLHPMPWDLERTTFVVRNESKYMHYETPHDDA